MAVRLLAQFAAILRGNADRERALLRDCRVVDDQHGILTPNLRVGPFSQHPPQRRIIPRRAADEVVQLVMATQPEPRCNRLHALRTIRPEQPTHIKRAPVPPRAAAHHSKKRRQPAIEVVTRRDRSGHSVLSAESQPDTERFRDRTSAKVVLVANPNRDQILAGHADSKFGREPVMEVDEVALQLAQTRVI